MARALLRPCNSVRVWGRSGGGGLVWKTCWVTAAEVGSRDEAENNRNSRSGVPEGNGPHSVSRRALMTSEVSGLKQCLTIGR